MAAIVQVAPIYNKGINDEIITTLLIKQKTAPLGLAT